MEKILIVGAHYDDTELGVGGTAARLAEEGKEVFKLTLTDNITEFEKKNIFIRQDTCLEQSRKACKVLGVKEIQGFPVAQCSNLTYSKKIMQRVESLIFDLNIDTVFIHFGNDMNQDHVEAARICLTAARHCRNILQYQSNGYILDNEFYPTFFVDISSYIQKKKEALACYGKEHDRFQRLFSSNIERNHIWGFANEVDYAEGFRIIKMII